MANIFVSKLGNDLGAGTQADPFLTLWKAYDTSVSGDVIQLADASSVWEESSSDGWGSGGSINWDKPGVTINSIFPEARCIIKGEGNGTQSVYLGSDSSGTSFTNVIFQSCHGNNAAVVRANSTATDTSDITFVNCEFTCVNAMGSGSSLVLGNANASSTGWRFIGCSFNSGARDIHSVRPQSDGWILTGCKLQSNGVQHSVAIDRATANFNVQACIFNGGAVGTTGTALDQPVHITMTDCIFSCVSGAVSLSGTLSNPISLSATGCRFLGGNGSAFTSTHTKSSLLDCIFSSAADALVVNDKSDASVIDCHITSSGSLSSCVTSTLTGKLFINKSNISGMSAQNCISVAGSDHVIVGNTIVGGLESTIKMVGTSNVEIDGNTILSSTDGIAVAFLFGSNPCSSTRIAQNRFTLSSGTVYDASSANSHISNYSNFNNYVLTDTASYGIVGTDTDVQTLTELQAAWGLAGNDSHSGNGILPPKNSIAEIVSGVWNELQASYTTAGTFGANLDAQVSAAGGGESAADIYSYFTTTGDMLTETEYDDSLPSNFDTLIIGTGADAGKVTTSNPAAGSGSSHTAQDVANLILATPNTPLANDGAGEVPANNMRGTDGANTVAPDNASVAAIKVKTDQMTYTVANQLDANALTGGGGDDAATIYSYFTASTREDAFKATGFNTVAPDNASVAAIKVKTDQMTYTVANQLDANALTGGGGDDAATIYSYFTASTREDAFKATGFNTVAPDNASVAAIKTTTDQFVFTIPGEVDSNAVSGGGAGGDSAATIYTYFTSGTNEDVFKADISSLATTADLTALEVGSLATIDSEIGTLQADVTDVKAKTDQLTFSIAGRVDANALASGSESAGGSTLRAY